MITIYSKFTILGLSLLFLVLVYTKHQSLISAYFWGWEVVFLTKETHIRNHRFRKKFGSLNADTKKNLLR